MEPLLGCGLPFWSPEFKAEALSLALCLLLLGSPHSALTVSLCKEEEYPVGDQCCPKCSPGFRVKETCGEAIATKCVPCTPGTYTAHLNGLDECLSCRVCDPDMGLVTRRECSPTTNTVCVCDRGHFCVQEHGDDCAECRPHGVCRPGQRVQETGTQWQDTVCEDCPPETFSPSGTLAECQPWTRCSGPLEKEVKPGTNSTDVTCFSMRLWLYVGVSLGTLLLLLCVLVIMVKRFRSSCGLCLLLDTCPFSGRKFSPQREARQAEGDAATLQAIVVPTFLPDVTTEAVEETASMI